MPVTSLYTLLQQQTAIVQELGIYFNQPRYQPMPRDITRLQDITRRAQDVVALCHALEDVFRQRQN